MILTSKGRYAVIAVVDISNQPVSKPITLAMIAKKNNISISYLEQIFIKLKKSNIVKAIRGPGGGYVLGRNGSDINIADIMKAIDEPIKITNCQGKKNCSKDLNQCRTHHLWYGLEKKIYQYLESISVPDICR
jgi:Rrf2 family iron-sulfur cluster assembly transcriptional regulator